MISEILYNSLSSSTGLTNVSKELSSSVKRDYEELKLERTENILRDPTEIYRTKLYLIYQKLKKSIEENRGYSTADELLNDLYIIYESLFENKGKVIANLQIMPLIYKVKTFGFHFVIMDIRQNSSFLRSAVDNILCNSATTTNYISLNEEEKVKILSDEILNPRPLLNSFSELKDQTWQVINELSLIKWGKENISIHATNDYVISNCESVSDILSALLLAKEAGLLHVVNKEIKESKLDILPLFETIEDLANAQQVMNILFENPAYREHLQARNKQQKIMIGYSDSNKDGGIVSSHFSLYKAQKELKDLCKSKNIDLVIFHGRGGSISRGGGPLNQSILAQPEGSIEGKIKITEQGEMISSKYLIPDIAKRSLELMTSAVIISSARSEFGNNDDNFDKYKNQFDIISSNALKHYREFITHPGFYYYFRTATPIDIIEHIEIGSRPASRKKGKDIRSLRAIPWVFSWTQNRQTISGWYGFGHSISKSVDDGVVSLEELKKMYKEWEFFKVLVDNIEMVLFKTDMIIGKEYVSLCDDKEKAGELFSLVKNEYELSTELVLQITGEENLLDHNKSLQRSLLLRNPYIDPISFIQVKFIKEFRNPKLSKQKKEKLLYLLRSTVNGIAAGIRNTG